MRTAPVADDDCRHDYGSADIVVIGVA